MGKVFAKGKHRHIQFAAACVAAAGLLVSLIGNAALGAAAETARQTTAANAAASVQSGPSVVVLPFANLSGNASEDFLSDGMAEEVHAALTRIRGLTAMGRGSALRFKGQDTDIRTIASALPSSHFLKGSVRKVEDRIRVAAQLVRADNGVEVWSENYYAVFEDIFEIQEDIARSVAGALRVNLNLRPGEMLVRNRTGDMDAYTNFLRARPMMRARGQQAFADAAVLLEQAVVADPDFAPAAALLAFDYDLTPIFQRALRSGQVAESKRFAESTVPRAELLARRATQLDPTSADAYVALAYANMAERKQLQADELFRQALALDPNHPDGLHGYSQLLAVMGRIEESIAMRRHLQALEPLLPNYTADTAIMIWLDGDSDTAIATLNAFRPGRTAELAQIQAALGRYREAASLLREMNAANYVPGMLESAARTLESAPAKAAPDSLPRVGNLAFVYLHAGAPERVLDFYEGNIEAGYFQPITTTFFWHPSYAPVRKTERFKAFVRDIGLVEVWRARGWPDLCRPVGANDFTCD